MKQSIQAERNVVLRLFDPMRKKHMSPNIQLNAGNTLQHETTKLLYVFSHMTGGHSVATEAYFKNGKRADIVCLDCRLIIEVAVSEKEESLVRKRSYYPKSLDLEVVRA